MKTACKKMITQQVSEILRIEIEDGDLYPGTKIPTDTELAEMFGVQKQIVRTAIEVLVKEGLLKYISDKEVYVLGHKIERNMEKLEGFTQTMLDRNMKPSFRWQEICMEICSALNQKSLFFILSACVMLTKIRFLWRNYIYRII